MNVNRPAFPGRIVSNDLITGIPNNSNEHGTICEAVALGKLKRVHMKRSEAQNQGKAC